MDCSGRSCCNPGLHYGSAGSPTFPTSDNLMEMKPPKELFLKKKTFLQGAPKKMHHSDLYPISVLEVGFYFFACVL